MEDITTGYLLRAEAWLFITTLAYFLMNGAQIFETAVIIPKWTAAPPESFHIFKGRYGLDFKVFWIAMHSLHEITFILAILFCWKLDAVRNGLLILLAIHFVVRAWTIMFFAPNIIEFAKKANSENTGEDLGEDLQTRTSLWRTLNYIRVAIFVGVSIALIPLLLKIHELSLTTE